MSLHVRILHSPYNKEKKEEEGKEEEQEKKKLKSTNPYRLEESRQVITKRNKNLLRYGNREVYKEDETGKE